ncbi:MAG: AraC family transcriptional regulator [Roseivirga sp.]|nr:AraC family transcriptional regulator [Roseivirga sp.]
MEGIQLNIWSVLVFVGAIQGFVMARAITGKQRPKANRYLAVFLIALSLHLMEYGIDISGLVLDIPHVFTASYPIIFLMGPAFYLYTQSLFEPDRDFDKKQLLHLIPSLIVLLLFMPFYLLSGVEKIALMQELGSSGTMEIPTGQFAFMGAHLLQTLIYVILAQAVLRKKQKELERISASTAIQQYGWIGKLTRAYMIYLGLYLLLLIILLSTKYYRVEIDYVMLLLTSLSVYAIGYTAMRQPVLFNALILTNGRQKTNLKTESQQEIKSRLESYFQSEKPYLNEELRLDDIATALSIPAYQLSEVINESFGKNFFEFTNSYRVEEAKRLLGNPQYSNLKILAVAFDAGFGNKATFNRVFKKNTGLTPSQFKTANVGG